MFKLLPNDAARVCVCVFSAQEVEQVQAECVTRLC